MSLEFAAVAALAGQLSGAMSILRTMVDMRDGAKLLEATNALQLKIAEAATSLTSVTLQNTELAAANRELRVQLNQAEDRLKDASHYALTTLPSGTLVYAYQPSGESDKPAHYACTRCWDADRKKVVLQPGRTTLDCRQCNAQYRVQPRTDPPKGSGSGRPLNWMG